MELKNVRIKEGESVRVVVYRNGKKFYIPLKAGKLMSYHECHSRDLRKKGTSSDR